MTSQEIKMLNVEIRIPIIKTKNELQHMSMKFQKIQINKMDEFRNQIKGWMLMLSYVIAIQVINEENKQKKELCDKFKR